MRGAWPHSGAAPVSKAAFLPVHEKPVYRSYRYTVTVYRYTRLVPVKPKLRVRRHALGEVRVPAAPVALVVAVDLVPLHLQRRDDGLDLVADLR